MDPNVSILRNGVNELRGDSVTRFGWRLSVSDTVTPDQGRSETFLVDHIDGKAKMQMMGR